MNIAVLGTGRVGATLGRRWAAAGHQVAFGSRDPQGGKAAQAVQQAGPNARSVSQAGAVANADVVLLAVPYSAAQSVLSSLGESLTGKTLIDCLNPLKPDLSGLLVGGDTSAGEQVAAWAPTARVVKAFNTASTATMANPVYDGRKAAMFYCGDSAEAKTDVRTLIADLEFEPVDSGPLTHSRYLEPLAMLYIHLAVRGGWGSQCAIQITKR